MGSERVESQTEDGVEESWGFDWVWGEEYAHQSRKLEREKESGLVFAICLLKCSV